RGDRAEAFGELLVGPHVPVLVDLSQPLAQLLGVGDRRQCVRVEGPLQVSLQPVLRPVGEDHLPGRDGVHGDPLAGPVPHLDVVVGADLVDVVDALAPPAGLTSWAPMRSRPSSSARSTSPMRSSVRTRRATVLLGNSVRSASSVIPRSPAVSASRRWNALTTDWTLGICPFP